MGWKYKTEAERIAAEKAYQAAYRALRKSGKWVRKNKIHSPQIAAKCGATVEPPVAPVKPVAGDILLQNAVRPRMISAAGDQGRQGRRSRRHAFGPFRGWPRK